MRAKQSALFVALALVATILMVIPTASAADGECDPEYVTVAGSKIRVAPTGVDDTENLQCALDMAAAMPWGAVILEAAEYFSGHLAVEGLNGVFRGAGSDATHLYTLPAGLDCKGWFEDHGENYFLTLGGGDVKLKGMSIGVGADPMCTEPWLELYEDGRLVEQDGSIEAVGVTSHVPAPAGCPVGQPITLKMIDVAIHGGFNFEFVDDVLVWDGFSHGVFVTPFHWRWGECPERLTGDITIRDSSVAETALGYAVYMVDDSTIKIVDSDVDGAWVGIDITNLSGSRAVVKRNAVVNVENWGIFGQVFEFPGTEPFDFVVRDNYVQAILWADGIAAADWESEYTGQFLINAKIVDNEVEMLGTPFNGVVAILDQGGRIARNTVHGESDAGVAVFADGWTLKHNDFADFTPYTSDVMLFGDDNRVVCLDSTDEVLDFGLGNELSGCMTIEEAAASGSAEHSDAPTWLRNKPGAARLAPGR